jgi:hypothetical protein
MSLAMLSPEPKMRENVPVAMSVVIIVLCSELKVMEIGRWVDRTWKSQEHFKINTAF